jgi:hypothetical protein
MLRATPMASCRLRSTSFSTSLDAPRSRMLHALGSWVAHAHVHAGEVHGCGTTEEGGSTGARAVAPGATEGSPRPLLHHHNLVDIDGCMPTLQALL